MDQEKPPTQHIRPAPAIDPNEYLDRELKEFGYKHGKKMGAMLEILVANHIHIRCVAEAVRGTDLLEPVSSLVIEHNMACLRRAAAMGDLSQGQIDEVAQKSNEIIDCIDRLVDPTETNLH